MNNFAFTLSIFSLKSVLRILLGIVGMAACANISIPLDPVPLTFSTVMVMVIGLTYSQRDAVATMSGYLAAGAAGLPVFANFNATIPYMLGTTGGYLVGFLIAAWIMSYIKERFDIAPLYNCVIGHIVIYICGVLWLSTIIGLDMAIYKGFIIYIPTGIVKILALVSLLKMIKH